MTSPSIVENNRNPPQPSSRFQDPTLISDYNLWKQGLMAVLFVTGHYLLWPTLSKAYFQLLRANPWNLLLASRYIDVQFFAAFIGTTVVHELIHVVMAQHYNFDWDLGINWVGPYILLADQYITRWQYKRMVIAPLVGISSIGGIGLVLPVGQQLRTIAALVLLVNTASAAGDLIDYLLYHQTPSGTMFCNIETDDEILTYAYRPQT